MLRHMLQRSLELLSISLLKRHTSTLSQYGICFDIDGVISRGLNPIPEAVEAVRLLCDQNTSQPKVPFVFLTNGFGSAWVKASRLRDWLKCEISDEQVIHSHTPLLTLGPSLRRKSCVIVGQGPVVDIAQQELGIEHAVSIDELSDAYPLLDVIDHDKSRAASELRITESLSPPLVDTVIVCGEPKHWETPLQLLVDLLLTNGRPAAGNSREFRQTLPVILCNPDLQYMSRSCFPRFGNGAFILCLEALFKKVTGADLKYSVIIGKPSEITFRFAEHMLAKVALKMHLPSPTTLYMIGDNMEADILGANLYRRYLSGVMVPEPRRVPADAPVLPQTVQHVESILVSTGVHCSNTVAGSRSQQTAGSDLGPAANDLGLAVGLDNALGSSVSDLGRACQGHCHRDFVADVTADLFRPTLFVSNVGDAVRYILQKQHGDVS